MPKMSHLYYYKVKEIVKIVDGDTVDFRVDCGFELSIKIRLRLSKINAWESRTRNLKEKKTWTCSQGETQGDMRRGNGTESAEDINNKEGKIREILRCHLGQGEICQ